MMKNINTKYIQDNFVEGEFILQHFGLEKSEFEKLIEDKIIPQASYKIERANRITSSLNDEIVESYMEEYFPKSIINLLEKYLKNKISAKEEKINFKENFKQNLTNHNDREFAYGNIFEGDKLNEIAFDHNFEIEWDFYAKGVYGICTLNATEEEIVEKEIAVKKIKKLYEATENRKLTDDEVKELIELNKQFNAIAALFAPYQRESSSRGKYLDTLLRKANLHDEIKKYE